MSNTLDLFPLGKSPERILEERQEKRPRQYAMDIFRRYPEHERLLQVDRLVPPHLRNAVREHLRVAARLEQQLRAKGGA